MGRIEDIKINLKIKKLDEAESGMMQLIEYIEEQRKILQFQCSHTEIIINIANGRQVCKWCGDEIKKQ
jgi:hypothetical protein